MDNARDGVLMSHLNNSYNTNIEDRDKQHVTVIASGFDVLEDGAVATKRRNPDGDGHCAGASLLLHRDDDNINEDSENDFPPTASRCTAGYMSKDSDDTDFDLLRTLRHYRRGHRHRHHSSSSSGCSCESCVSDSDNSFFGSDEGPPGGENTTPRRAYMWLENIRMNWGFLVLGLLVLSIAFTVIASVIAEASRNPQVGRHMLYWTVPLAAVTAVVIIAWKAAHQVLLRRGYGKGDYIMERWNLIRNAQAKELVYSVRGAIYAPTCRQQQSYRRSVYEVVGYESEFDSETYFDSDLESDGQYSRSLTTWQEVEDPCVMERRNIYTRRAWFRDVPVVWWELMPHTRGDL